MRALVAGRPATLAEVTYAVESARDTLPGTVGRVDNAFDALDLLDGSEPTTLFLEVTGPADPGLGQIRTLTSRGARVIVLAKEPSAELRVAALKAGARELLFAPWTPARVRARLSGTAPVTGALPTGVETDFRALLYVEGTRDEIQGRVRNLSPGGCLVRIPPRSIPRDSVLRAAIQVPPPNRLPVLFGRATDDAATGSLTVRFVGLSEEEEGLLHAVIDAAGSAGDDDVTQRARAISRAGPSSAPARFEDPDPASVTRIAPAPPAPDTEALAALGRVISELDAAVLRGAPQKWLGLTLPVLTDAERVALVEGGSLAEVAVWRTRAHVIASIVEATPDMLAPNLPFAEWREGLALARERIRAEVAAHLADGAPGALREARDVQARLNAVSDRIDRLAREAGLRIDAAGGPLEEPSGPATFERPVTVPEPSSAGSAEQPPFRPPSRRMFRRALLSLAVVGAAGAAFAVERATRSRRAADPGRTAVAERPVLEAAGVRVRSVFRKGDPPRTIVVVDGSWYERGYHTTREKGEDAARVIAGRLSLSGHVQVRDYAGRKLAEIGKPADPAATGATTGALPPATPAPSPGSRATSPPPPRASTPARAPASPSR